MDEWGDYLPGVHTHPNMQCICPINSMFDRGKSHKEGAQIMTEDWIDVSIPLRTGMVHWPDNPPVAIERMLDIERGDVATVSKLSMGVHTGTHLTRCFKRQAQQCVDI